SDAAEMTDRSLAGHHIAITRPLEQAEDLARLLEAAGARGTSLSPIAIAPLEDTTELDAALEQLAGFDWVVLTSVNGVPAVADRLAALGRRWAAVGDRPAGRGRSWADRGDAGSAVVGPATAQALEAFGIRPDFVPEEYVAEAIAQGLQGLGAVAGRRVLLLRADIARRTLAD